MEFLRSTDQIQEQSKIFLHKEECACCSRVEEKYAYIRLTKLPNVDSMMSFHSFDFYHLICRKCHEQIREAKQTFKPSMFPKWSMLKEMLICPMMLEDYRFISEPLDEIDDTDYSAEDHSPWYCTPWGWFNNTSSGEYEELIRECSMEKFVNNGVNIYRLIANGNLPLDMMYRVAQFC